MSDIVLPRRRAHGCCGDVWMPALTADDIDRAYVRRAVLPWRRRVRPLVADCLADALLGRHPRGWRRPAHVVLRLVGLVGVLVLAVPALVELLAELLAHPFVTRRRARRGRWPVELVVAGSVRHVELCPTVEDAKERAFMMRMELIHLEPYEQLAEDGLVPAPVHDLDRHRAHTESVADVA